MIDPVRATTTLSALPLLALSSLGHLAAESMGPGLGNLDYTGSKALFDTVSVLDSTRNVRRGQGVIAMFKGYLLVVYSNDSGGGGGTGGFTLLNVADPRAPIPVLTTDGNPAFASGTSNYAGDLREAHGLAFRDNWFCAATNEGAGTGLQFWDFSVPTSDPTGASPKTATGPVKRAFLDLGLSGGDYSSTVWWLSWQGRYLYAAGTSSGLFIIDAADPAKPVLADRGAGKPNPIPTSQLGGFRVSQAFAVGNMLVMASGNRGKGISICDISDPLMPVVKWSTLDETVGYSCIVNGGRILGSHAPARCWDISGWMSGTVPPVRLFDNSDFGVGGYGTVQDGRFFYGSSEQVVKIDIASGDILGSKVPRKADQTSLFSNADWDFSQALGNLMWAGNDHSSGSALLVHQLKPDVTPPAVTMVVPADGATEQKVTSRIGLTFSDLILPESVNASTMVVRPVGSTAALAGTYASQTGIVNFSPAQPLLGGVTYEVVLVAGGIEDSVGNGIGSTFRSTFTTAGASQQPLAITLSAPAPAAVGTTMEFSGTGSGGTGTRQYSWNFGDGTTTAFSNDASADHAYAAPGHYAVSVTVRDGNGTTASASRVVTVHRPLTATPARNSTAILGDPARSRVFVVNPDNDTVSAIATGDLAKSWERPVGDQPRAIAQDADGNLWVANQGSDSISILAPATGATVATIALPRGAAPHGICFAPDGETAYVAYEGLGQVQRFSRGTRQALGAALAVGPWPRGLAVTGDGSRLLVTRFVSPADVGQVYDVSTSAFTLTRTIPLAHDAGHGGAQPDLEDNARGTPNYLSAVAISPDGARAWIPSKKDNTDRGTFRDGRGLTFDSTVRTIASQIDLAANAEALAARMDFDDSDMAIAVAFSPRGDWAFVAFQGSNQVHVVDAYSGQIAHTIESTGLAPQGLALIGDRLFVHNFMSRTVRAYSVASILDGTDMVAPAIGSAVATVASEALAPAVLRGKQIFYNAADSRMSQDGYISCASCHLDGGSDQRIWDFTDRGEGLRNTTDLRGRGAGHGAVHWTANFDEIHDFENDIRLHFGGTGFLPQASWDDASIRDPLGSPKAGISSQLDDLAAYVGSLRTVGASPHRAADGGLTSAGRAGREVFRRLDCASCHVGNAFTDSASGARHDVGTITAASGKRAGAALTGIDTPTLRGLWNGAPYHHDGSAATLADVTAVAGHGTMSLLGQTDRQNLIAYLQQIDDAELEAPARPVVTIAAGDSAAAEAGDPGAFTIARVGQTDFDLTVLLQLGGTASGGTDYTSIPTTVVIPSGSASVSVAVSPIADTTVEGSETVVLTVSAGTHYRLGTATTATVSITDGGSADTTDPVLSSISAAVSGTGAVITWTSDEPSTSRVRYGIGGTTIDSGVAQTGVTAHTVTLTGLQPGATYQYLVESADAAGNVAVSGVLGFVIPAVATAAFQEAGGLLVMEAEHAHALSANGDAVAWSEAAALAGHAGEGYLTTTTTGLANATWATGCRASYDVSITTGGTYSVWVRVSAPDGAGNSVFVGSDGTQLGTGFISGGGSSGFSWHRHATTLALAPGAHVIELRRREDGHRVDRILLTTDADYVPGGVGPAESARGVPPTAVAVRVNFQPAQAAVPDGYLVDSGAIFADRGNGQSYGWNAANGTTRDRNSSAAPDQRYDTLIHLQKSSGMRWELAVPDGTYQVDLVCGDASYTDQINTLSIEGVVVVDEDGNDRFDEFTIQVTVSDGRLTITSAAGGSNAKLDFIQVVPVPAGNG